MTIVLPMLASPGDAAAMRAEIAMERLLNTWLREHMAGFVPIEGETCVIDVGINRLLAFCMQSSPGGFHRWRLPVKVEAEDRSSVAVDDPSVVAGMMANALLPGTGPAAPAIRDRLLSALRAAESHGRICASRPADCSPMGLEQALWHGHPFHPFAKSIDGFSAEDIEHYAPERSKEFQLRWILAERGAGAALWRDPDVESSACALLAELSGLPQKTIGDRLLIPSHPWQAARLENDPAFAALAAQGRAIITLPTGVPVQPTSSVRTVFVPDSNIFLKMPIEARITNFARTNPPEQVARSMAASRALDALRDHVANSGFKVLSESGAMWIDQPGLEAITGVILRDGPSGEAFVLAGLLEPSPSDGRPMLATMSCYLSSPANAETWLRAYVRAAIHPPLHLFARTGISVEAHSQNSLLVLDRGNPKRLIVRDLEGVSIDRTRFERVAPDLDFDPSVFFPAEEARERLIYYLISNNLNHVIATIVRLSNASEARLWRIAAGTLVAAAEDSETAELVEWLLAIDTLPAKANFSSCFAGNAERPAYVAIANPMRIAARHEQVPEIAAKSS
jgi:L-2,3-diaminopropanoate---citrate ligase